MSSAQTAVNGINYWLTDIWDDDYGCYTANVAKGNYKGDIVIPETVTYGGKTYAVLGIDSKAFYGCTGLTSVKLPDLEKIGEYAFCGCTGLNKLEMPYRIKTIQTGAFEGCSIGEVSFESVYSMCNNFIYAEITSNPLFYTEHLLIGGEEVSSITIDCEKVNDYAFICDEDLDMPYTNIVITDRVKKIGKYAFLGFYSDNTLTIPESVISIGDGAFCNLSYVYFKASYPPVLGQNVFSDKCRIYVNEDAYNYYSRSPYLNGEKVQVKNLPQCSTPTVTNTDGNFTAQCTTEGSVIDYTQEVLYYVKDEDTGQIKYSPTVKLSIFAKCEGYKNSEPVVFMIPINKGDVNNDGTVNISDVTEVVKSVLKK